MDNEILNDKYNEYMGLIQQYDGMLTPENTELFQLIHENKQFMDQMYSREQKSETEFPLQAIKAPDSVKELEKSLNNELSKILEEQRKATNELKRQADVLEKQLKQAKEAAKEAKDDAIFSKHLSIASLIVSILAISAGSFGSVIIEIIKSVLKQLPS